MRIAVIGAGSIGRRHLADLVAIGGHQLTVYDNNPAVLDSIDGDPRWTVHGLPQTLWAWKPQAVIICTPPDSHMNWADQAFIHDCHAFIEKPLALELPAIIESAGWITHVACPLRYVPEFMNAKRHIGNDPSRFAPILVSIVGQYNLYRDRPDYLTSYHVQTGALLDIGSHAVDLAQWMFGPAVIQRALIRNDPWLHLPDNCDSGAELLLQHGKAPTVAIAVNWSCENRLWRVMAGVAESALETGFTAPTDIDSAYRAEMAAFLDCCETGKPADNPLSEARRTLALLLEAKRCAR